MLSDVCLSVTYIGPKSRTERPRKTKIGTEVAHVTRDSDTTFKVKRSKVKVTEGGAYCGGSLTVVIISVLKHVNNTWDIEAIYNFSRVHSFTFDLTCFLTGQLNEVWIFLLQCHWILSRVRHGLLSRRASRGLTYTWVSCSCFTSVNCRRSGPPRLNVAMYVHVCMYVMYVCRPTWLLSTANECEMNHVSWENEDGEKPERERERERERDSGSMWVRRQVVNV